MRAAALGFASLALVAAGAQASPRPRRACRPGEVFLSLETRRAGDSVVAVVTVGHTESRTCRVRLRLTVEIRAQGEQDALAGVRGNPAAASLDREVRYGGRVSLAWRWSNWCGPQGRLVVSAAGAGQEDLVRQPFAPRCRARGAPSTLRSLPNVPRAPA